MTTTEFAAMDWSEYPLTEIDAAEVLEIRARCVGLLKALRRLQGVAASPQRYPTYPRDIDIWTAFDHLYWLERGLNPDRMPFDCEQHSNLHVCFEDEENDFWLALNWLRKLLNVLLVANSGQDIAARYTQSAYFEQLDLTTFRFEESSIRELRFIIRLLDREKLEEWAKRVEERRDAGRTGKSKAEHRTKP